MQAPANVKKRSPYRVMIVLSELLGLTPPSERAASLSGQVQMLAASAPDAKISVLFVGTDGNEAALEVSAFEGVRHYYDECFGVSVQRLPPSPELLADQNSDEKLSLELYHYLKRHEADDVYLQLGGGLAYYTLLAREMGVFKPRGRLQLLACEPLLWQSEADRSFLGSLAQIATAYRERYCVEHCDSVIFESEAMKDWMRGKNWQFPADSPVLPALAPREWRYVGGEAGGSPSKKLEEVVFIGETKFRHGLTLFCDAMDKLTEWGTAPLTVTFLGTFDHILGEHTGGMLLRRARRWPSRLKILPRSAWDETLRHLRENPCLVVSPALAADARVSLAALVGEGIPFVATKVGGIGEVVDSSEAEHCLAEPEAAALATKIRRMLGAEAEPIEPAKPFPDTKRRWETRFARNADPQEKLRQARVEDAAHPLVSVVLVHHDRPELLAQAVDSVLGQSYPNLELILVDDGSRLPESHSRLDGYEALFCERGWRILREPNRYLGAARNTGVRAARGAMILFLDDDNVLMPQATASLVRAMEYSGADICTCLCRLLFSSAAPEDGTPGQIHYLPMGGSLDLAFFHNSIGDANAMIRRSVFDRIGYLLEDYGYTCHDWEFFTRAIFGGLKVRLLPEALYWYRQDVSGMYRRSQWYDNRAPILALMKHHHFEGMDLFYHLALTSHVGTHDRESLGYNLTLNPADLPFTQLRGVAPDSDRALEILVRLAREEGRTDTAEMIEGQMRHWQEEALARRLESRARILTADDAAAAADAESIQFSPSMRGHVEEITPQPSGLLRIAGWVIDLGEDNPIPSVAVFKNGELLGVVEPRGIRPDLVEGFKAPHLGSADAQFSLLCPSAPGDGGAIVCVAINSQRQYHVLGA